MRVLLVEDERHLAEFVRKGLKENGHAVDVACDGDEGELLAGTDAYDVLILDIMLPGQSGFEVVRKVRAAGISKPVLFLTARDDVADRVRGLDLGADDYLVKPFAFDELLARLRALERRSGSVAPTELRCHDLVVNLPQRKVTRAGKTIDLTPKEFSLLECLLRRCGEVVTRTSIIEKVWDIHFDAFTNAMDVLVNRLRKKVDEPFREQLIHTVRGVGYVLRHAGD
jgi:heavy metal response regulator